MNDDKSAVGAFLQMYFEEFWNGNIEVVTEYASPTVLEVAQRSSMTFRFSEGMWWTRRSFWFFHVKCSREHRVQVNTRTIFRGILGICICCLIVKSSACSKIRPKTRHGWLHEKWVTVTHGLLPLTPTRYMWAVEDRWAARHWWLVEKWGVVR